MNVKRTRAAVVVGRCSRNHQADLFGMRFEESGEGIWVADWAFVIPEATARRERYDQQEIEGEFGFATRYPGCPHCEAASIFRCSCGKVACWGGQSRKVSCPWCRQRIQLTDTIRVLGADGDR